MWGTNVKRDVTPVLLRRAKVPQSDISLSPASPN